MTTPRRRRMWTADEGVATLTAAGVAGQKHLSMVNNFISSTGLASMMGCTIARTHICALIVSGGSETGTGFFTLTMGAGVFPVGMDPGDYPALSTFDGSWLAYECSIFKLPGAIDTVVKPDEAGFFRVDSRAQRKISRPGEQLTMVFELDVAPGSAINVRVAYSLLVLLP